jgi:hypothetical protein
MKWMRERDALIAQTLAFVQSVTGRRDAGEPFPPVAPEPAAAPPPAAVPSPVVAAIVEVPDSLAKSTPEKSGLDERSLEKSAQPAPPSASPRALVPSDLQRELKARIESFRAHQERFNREREEYFSATLARLRAAIKDGPPPTPRA